MDQTTQIEPSQNKSKDFFIKFILGFIFILAVVSPTIVILNKFLFKKENPPVMSPTLPPNAKPFESLASSHNLFGFNILHLLQKEDTDKNIFISPASIHLALSMTYNGAEEQTKEDMAKALQIQGVDKEKLNSESSSLMTALQNPDPKVQIAIANSIWAEKSSKFSPEFLGTMQSSYKAKIESLDFKDPNSVNIMNSWVSENTKGKIPTIIDPPIPPGMVMYLFNAIYFKGTWTTEFDKSLTKDRDFTLKDGSIIKTKMMQQKDNFNYLENDQFQAISIPYGENKQLSMYIFKPNGELESFIETLNLENWKNWLSKFSITEGTIILPKFKTKYEKTLNEVLTNLGMGIVFTGIANFNGMKNSPNDPSLFISEVIHKTYIDVNEEGTEAAAVTGVGMMITSVGPSEKKIFYMEVNKPFFYAIVDQKSSEILFMGIIQNPIK